MYQTMTKNKQITLDQILKALGEPVRLSVIKQLLDTKEHEKACGTFDYQINKATFSHHIKILVEAGILCERLEGTRKYLSINSALEETYPEIFKLIQKSK